MFKSQITRVTMPIVSIILLFMVTACGNRDPYGTGLSSFTDEVTSYTGDHPISSEWTVFVAHGLVTTGWLWLCKQHDVIYSELELQSNETLQDLTIQFGDKTVHEPAEGGGGGISGTGFYITSSTIPPVMDISWRENGTIYHTKIDSKSMVELPSLDGSS
ncbi:hypothetical protein [Alicyclobacillus dauci]|uniref:Uncharacterized protein n=1 Tax=Alicyclobacillus dauci TaxID=1475485 RepID=A0ABY6Z1Y8_9BACL|nr:hypothetical protein [Alicyclobacillus dauci]WAH36760.1 hypothetical protein NZD86_21720 [Alicyclobacillus dauci]